MVEACLEIRETHHSISILLYAAARPRILSPKPTPDPSRLGASGHGDDTLLGGCPIPYIVTAASAAAPSLDGPLDQPPGQPALSLSRSPLYRGQPVLLKDCR